MTEGENPIRAVVPDLWVAESPHRLAGLHLGTRMTIVKLKSGRLWLHSPIAISPELQTAISEIGQVAHIVCPNVFHHVYAADAVRAFPCARLYGPSKLLRKRKDLRFDAVLSEASNEEWAAEVFAITIEGSLMHETVFFHRASKTLISSDLVENFSTCNHAPTRLYLRLGGLLGRVGWHHFLKPVYFNRLAAQASVKRILRLPFERVVLAHGEIISHDARQSVRDGLAWLLVVGRRKHPTIDSH